MSSTINSQNAKVSTRHLPLSPPRRRLRMSKEACGTSSERRAATRCLPSFGPSGSQPERRQDAAEGERDVPIIRYSKHASRICTLRYTWKYVSHALARVIFLGLTIVHDKRNSSNKELPWYPISIRGIPFVYVLQLNWFTPPTDDLCRTDDLFPIHDLDLSEQVNP